MKDPIVEEVREARARIAEECGYDLTRIIEHARRAAAKIAGLRNVTMDEMNTRRPNDATTRSANGGDG